MIRKRIICPFCEYKLSGNEVINFAIKPLVCPGCKKQFVVQEQTVYEMTKLGKCISCDEEGYLFDTNSFGGYWNLCKSCIDEVYERIVGVQND